MSALEERLFRAMRRDFAQAVDGRHRDKAARRAHEAERIAAAARRRTLNALRGAEAWEA